MVWLQFHVLQHCPTSGRVSPVPRHRSRSLRGLLVGGLVYLEPISGPRTVRESGSRSSPCSAQCSLCSSVRHILVAWSSEFSLCLLCSVKHLSTLNPADPHFTLEALSVQCVHSSATMPFFSLTYPDSTESSSPIPPRPYPSFYITVRVEKKIAE